MDNGGGLFSKDIELDAVDLILTLTLLEVTAFRVCIAACGVAHWPEMLALKSLVSPSSCKPLPLNRGSCLCPEIHSDGYSRKPRPQRASLRQLLRGW